MSFSPNVRRAGRRGSHLWAATLQRDGKLLALRCVHSGEWFVMLGGAWGEHRISADVSSLARLVAHWEGYLSNQLEEVAS